MKVAPKLVLVFKDQEGFGAAIFDALQPTPQSSLHRSEEKFQLALVSYGIMDQNACGSIANFTDNKGLLQVSVLLLEYYEPPILSCVVNEVLKSIRGDNLSSSVCLTLPFILPDAKLKCEDRSSPYTSKCSLYAMHMGPITEMANILVKDSEKPPSSLQIHYEPLACLLQLVCCLNLPTVVLLGKSGVKAEHEVLNEVGERLASAFSLYFMKNQIKLNFGVTAKPKEPWRELYG